MCVGEGDSLPVKENAMLVFLQDTLSFSHKAYGFQTQQTIKKQVKDLWFKNTKAIDQETLLWFLDQKPSIEKDQRASYLRENGQVNRSNTVAVVLMESIWKVCWDTLVPEGMDAMLKDRLF